MTVGSMRPAAVLLPLFEREGEPHLVFIRRTEEVRHHQGEISFPGGAREAVDESLKATALREADEEIGLKAKDVTLLGRLDDFESIHGYHVVPYVGCFEAPYSFQPDPRETAEMIEVPLARLRDPAIFRVEDWTHQGRQVPVCFYSIDEHEIWGLTAEILRQFLEHTD
ncbi:MAG: CoA pyrophosphatase [Desulfuromonas sp.]|nr:MAG: CoA pyrophosphatase [Desulfuromonas sp.]